MTNRHPATEQLLSHFTYEHLGQPMQSTSKIICDAAHAAADGLEDGPELSAGLRKLLEAKDCLVRQRVADLRARAAEVPHNTPEPELR